MDIPQQAWPLFALFAAWLGGSQLIVNNHFKAPGHLIMVWRSIICIVLTLPFCLSMKWPDDPRFYIVSFLAGTIAVITGTMVYNASARFGSAVISRMLPMSILVAFVGWFIIDISRFAPLLETPLKTTGVLVALLGCSLSLSHLRKCDISRPALIYYLPIGILQGTNAVFQKTSQLHADLNIGPVLYVFLISCVTLIWSTSFGLYKHKLSMQQLFETKTLRAGLLIGVFYCLYLASQTTSAALTPNPGYMLAVAMSSPIWIHIYHSVRKHKIEGNIWAGLAFTGFAMLLVALTM